MILLVASQFQILLLIADHPVEETNFMETSFDSDTAQIIIAHMEFVTRCATCNYSCIAIFNAYLYIHNIDTII